MRHSRPRSPEATALFAVVMVVAAGGCGPEASPGASAEPEVPERDGRVTLTIGELAGPEESTFGRITGLAFGLDDRILVLDAQASEVRVFGPDGSFLHTIGRAGEGPGEMDGGCCLAVADGRLWIRDTGNNRYLAFDLEEDGASFVETRPMEHGAGGLWTPLHVRNDTLLDVGGRMNVDQERMERARFRLGPGGSVRELPPVLEPPPSALPDIRAVDYENEGGAGRRWFYRPFGGTYLVAFDGDGRRAEAVSSAYRVVLRGGHREAADSLVLVREGVPGPSLTPEERETGQERLARIREMAGPAARQLDWDVPERKPPLETLFFDDRGRLWVVLTPQPDGPGRADVYGRDGTLLERRSWPAGVGLGLPGVVDGDRALGLVTDSLGVQRVARLVWE